MLEGQRLSGVALVTGAASGIGKDTAMLFAEAGCKAVVFADINEGGARKAAEESAKYASHPLYRATAIKVDVSDLESVRNMVKETVEAHGRIDYSVNSAGLGNSMPNPVADLDFAHFNRVMDTNMKGTVHCLSEVTKVMRGQEPLQYKPPSRPTWQVQPPTLSRGSIVNIVSAYAFFVQPGTLTYSSSKHGLIGVTKAAAIDHAKDGIRVNAVCPGGVETPMMDAAVARAPGFREKVEKGIPLHNRMAMPCELTSMVLFLSSPAANYITGSSHLVDAGLSLNAARL